MKYIFVDSLTMRTTIITDEQEFERMLEQVAPTGASVDSYAQVAITVVSYNYKMHHATMTRSRLQQPVVLN